MVLHSSLGELREPVFESLFVEHSPLLHPWWERLSPAHSAQVVWTFPGWWRQEAHRCPGPSSCREVVQQLKSAGAGPRTNPCLFCALWVLCLRTELLLLLSLPLCHWPASSRPAPEGESLDPRASLLLCHSIWALAIFRLLSLTAGLADCLRLFPLSEPLWTHLGWMWLVTQGSWRHLLDRERGLSVGWGLASVCSTYLEACLGLVLVPPAQDPHLVMRLVIAQLSR